MTLTVEFIDNPEPYIPGLRWFLSRFGKKHWTEYYSHEDAIQYVRDGVINLWVARNGDQAEIFVLTEVVSSPRCKAVVILWCGGKNVESHLPQFFKGIELYAKMIEADQVEIHGRPAWSKLLRPYGYKIRSVNLRKRIEDDHKDALESNADDPAGLEPGTERPAQLSNGAHQAGSREHPE